MKKVFSIVILFALLLISSQDAAAQCSMCRAVVENNTTNIGQGLNNGIVYLMAVPYALIIFSGVFLFRKQFKDKQTFQKT
tara:strand:- start:1962 stop:2201 length:240 start_codon:yes stop_codon:yes gene_type:complete